MNRKRVILAALLGIWAVSMLYAYLATPRLEKAPPRASAEQGRPAGKLAGEQRSDESLERINFDYLAVQSQEFPGARRDIFRYVQRRPIRAVPTVVAPPVRPVVPVPPPVPINVVQQELSKFTFLGFLEKSGEKLVFLSSRGILFLASRGESFGVNHEFQVADIDDNLLKVRRTGRDDLVEIPLIEKQKLTASVKVPSRGTSLSGASQPRSQSLAPRRRLIRPEEPQETEEQPLPEMNEENNPEEGQGAEPPVPGDVTGGDVNGTNQ